MKEKNEKKKKKADFSTTQMGRADPTTQSDWLDPMTHLGWTGWETHTG